MTLHITKDNIINIITSNPSKILNPKLGAICYGVNMYTDIDIEPLNIKYSDAINNYIPNVYKSVNDIHKDLVCIYNQYLKNGTEGSLKWHDLNGHYNPEFVYEKPSNNKVFMLSINERNLYYENNDKSKYILLYIAYMKYYKSNSLLARIEHEFNNIHEPDTSEVVLDKDEGVANVPLISTIDYKDLFREVMTSTDDKYLAALKNYIIADWLNNYRRLVFNLQWLINIHAEYSGEILNLYKLYNTFINWYENKLRKFNCTLFVDCTSGLPGELIKVLEHSEGGKLATNNLRYEFREYMEIPQDLNIEDAYKYVCENLNTYTEGIH